MTCPGDATSRVTNRPTTRLSAAVSTEAPAGVPEKEALGVHEASQLQCRAKPQLHDKQPASGDHQKARISNGIRTEPGAVSDSTVCAHPPGHTGRSFRIADAQGRVRSS